MATRDNWSSKLGFILSAAGSAIGLGAIWKFPYTAGTHGGAVFLILFMLFTFLVAAPILIAEFAIGRHSRHSAIQAFHRLMPRTLWPGIGWLGVVTCFILLSFYSVVGGWVVAYVWHGVLGHLRAGTDYAAFFAAMIANPWQAVAFQGLFMLATVAVVQGGISRGIEKANKYMMPALFIMFILLAVRSLTLEGAWAGVAFLFAPDWSYLTPATLLAALGQAFFALSIGVSAMITYASYLRDDHDLLRSANSIVWMNLFISILAGLVIFPAVFALGFAPNQGPGLIFAILPAVFAELPFGIPLFVVFMVLVLFATLTSAFSMLETIVAAVVYKHPERRSARTFAIGIATFLAGIPSALSFGVLAEVKLPGGRGIFDTLDYLVTGWSMPLGALLIAIFTTWAWRKRIVEKEVMTGSTLPTALFHGWHALVRYLAPVAIVLVLLNSSGLLAWLQESGK
ncbi:MAG: sodium-dependent transporter [Cardiobacteriaceae bacterium]|nr:sodium-dependent transporter [Cardiobacteriaceae bacterium]